MNGVAGQRWLTLTARVTLPVRPSVRKTRSTAPTPSAVQNGRRPSTPSSSPAALLRAQTWVSRLWLLPSPSSEFGSRLGSPRVSSTLSGPRLLALVESMS
jgi:hypothetical protein